MLLGLFLPPGIALAVDNAQVSRLEASHVAEIHTGGVAEKIELESRKGSLVYRLDTRRGDEAFRVEVHGGHGRLLAMQRTTVTGPVTLYQWPGVRVVAHRGGALLGPPENTIAAIEKAIQAGADLIEIDIRQTADGHLVLMHDETVDRTTDGSGRVDEMTLADLRLLKVRHDGNETIRVPTLDTALMAMKGRIDPDLDFKKGDLERLLSIVRQLELAEQSTMHGPWDRALEVMVREPKLRIRPTADYAQQVPELIRKLRPAMVNLDWHAVTEEAVRLAHLGGCHAFVNCLETADTEFCIGRAIEIGADYIQSDRPDMVIKMLKARGLRDAKPPRGDPLGTPLRGAHLAYPLW